jgi:pimeloyl-ACP methyl ester carboxylesterase
LLLGAAAAPAQDVDWIAVKGASVERVPVPVFAGRVALYRAGKRGAEPVILIHGMGHPAARDWAQVIPGLAAAGYDVYALDLPGFGASDKGNHDYSPANYVRVLDALFAGRLKRPADVVGHSMGGVVALAYAAAYPERVRRLVVVDAAGVLHRSVYGEFLGRMLAERKVGADSPWLEMLNRLIATQAENLAAKAGAFDNPLVRQRLLRGDPSAIAGYALVEHDLSRGLRAIKAPTLVIWSSDDKVAPPRTGQALASVIPGARLALIDEAGHAPQVTQPERFNALLRDELLGKLDLKPYALPPGPPAGGHKGSCVSERGRRFSGDYEVISLQGCADVEISDGHIGRLVVARSQVRVVNSHVRDGVESHDSRIEFTGGSLGGDPPLSLDETNVDAAALRFEPRGRVVAENYGEGPVTLRLSVSEIAGGGDARYAHQVLRLVEDQSWTPRGAR